MMGVASPSVGIPLSSGAQVYKWGGGGTTSSFVIVGEDTQVVEVSLAPGEVVRSEPGTIMHMHQSLQPQITSDQVFGHAIGSPSCPSFCLPRLLCKSSPPHQMASLRTSSQALTSSTHPTYGELPGRCQRAVRCCEGQGL